MKSADGPRLSSMLKWILLVLSIIGGTTPSYLNSFLPEGAWDQGFTSRTIFVYSGEPVFTEIFGDEEGFARLESEYLALLADLKRISGLYGKLSWEPDAAAAISEWNRRGLAPVPEHNKLTHYNTRRLAHVIKLCMVACVSRTNDLRITAHDYQTALGWLLEVETFIPDLFNSHGVAGDTAAIDDAWDFVFRAYNKDGKKPVLEHRLVNFFRTKVPSHNIMKVIEIMERSGIIKGEITTVGKAFHPAPKA
jgi:hypothetical protein